MKRLTFIQRNYGEYMSTARANHAFLYRISYVRQDDSYVVTFVNVGSYVPDLEIGKFEKLPAAKAFEVYVPDQLANVEKSSITNLSLEPNIDSVLDGYTPTS